MYMVTNFGSVLPNDVVEFYAMEAKDIAEEGFEVDAVVIIPWVALLLLLKKIKTQNIRGNNK